MKWFASFGVAALTAIVGVVVGGVIANFCVSWYSISSFEGGSGYFVVAMALIGGFAGFVIGMIASRYIAASATPGLWRALGTAVGAVLTIGIVIVLPARLLADVPPEIDGETLLVAFELKWPASQTTDPRTMPGLPVSYLRSSSGNVVRKSDRGAFFLEDAHLEDGRWVAGGGTYIFTNRGQRVLDVSVGDSTLAGFILPMTSPKPSHREWSEWFPGLVVHDGESTQSGNCELLVDDGGTLKRTPAGSCMAPVTAKVLTSDAAAYAESQKSVAVRGWVDFWTFRNPAMYRVDHSVIDTRSLRVIPFELPTEPWFPQSSFGLLDVSPDERSVGWFAYRNNTEDGYIGVTDYHANHSYAHEIDRARMRYNEPEDLDPAWVRYHFKWVKGADGVDSLVPRTDFIPKPYVAQLEVSAAGEVTGMYLRPAGDPIRLAMVELLANELGGTRAPDMYDGSQNVVMFDKVEVHVSTVESGGFVAISTYDKNQSVMKRIADGVNRALATGKYDSLFRQ